MRLPTRGTKVADKYELVEEIGRGGMGVVWRAYAESLGLHCALKMVLPGFGAQRERTRLLREARMAAKLRSPYVVNTYDVGEWDGCAFIAMELLEGQPLSKVLEEAGTFTAPFTIELMRQLALGLEKAHAAGLVHRDLKPDNIFVVEREPLLVKLLDFGVAKRLSVDTDSTQVQSMEGAIIGTPRYMSPEQARGAAELDFRSDLWALAVIAYECMTGEPPFDGDTWPHLLVNVCTAPLPVPSERCATVPPGFDAFWLSTAARDPALRPASARAFADELRQALTHAPRAPARAVARTVQMTAEPPRRNQLWLGVALTTVAAVSGGTAYLLGQRAAREAAPVIAVHDEPSQIEHSASPAVALQDPAAVSGSARKAPSTAAAAIAQTAAERATHDAPPPSAADAVASAPQPSAAQTTTIDAARLTAANSAGQPPRNQPQPAKRAPKANEAPTPERLQPTRPPANTAVDDDLGF